MAAVGVLFDASAGSGASVRKSARLRSKQGINAEEKTEAAPRCNAEEATKEVPAPLAASKAKPKAKRKGKAAAIPVLLEREEEKAEDLEPQQELSVSPTYHALDALPSAHTQAIVSDLPHGSELEEEEEEEECHEEYLDLDFEDEDSSDLADLVAEKLDSLSSARLTRAGPHVGSSRSKTSRRGARRINAAEDQIVAYRVNKTSRAAAAAAAAATSSTLSCTSAPSKRPNARTRKAERNKAKDRQARLSHPRGLELDVEQTIETDSYWFGEPLPLDKAIAACVKEAPTTAAQHEERCAICMEEFLSSDPEVREYYANQRVVQLPKCAARHPFHSECIAAALSATPRCPVCMVPMAAACGTQPDGVMTLQRIVSRLPGETCDTVVVNYHFPSGRQGPRHPSPGQAFYGTGRTAYFPYSARGRVVLQQLMRAWDARVLFTVGTSVTTGQTDCVVWNGVHHKTSMSGGPVHYGYPDANYLDRVSEERACVGVLYGVCT
jgi:deltex